ncbi:MAG: hypothetical protein HKN57_13635 [Xanthomonadales bacterium]|nr:hypothetical protein [Gammaproteobacteria bacterium]NND58282.1 hypothetical protein [Xanthomonadales bacterium]NNK52007.1 hypothetical protein [Xanthomonadales bacterium]
MRSGTSKFSMLVCALIAVTNTFAAPFALDVLETDDLRLLYFDPMQTYLTPHVARSFHNSLEFQKYIFNWQPWEKTTVLLTDFTDYGNAAAGVVPNNFVQIEVAPLSRTHETFPASERVYMLLNHEMVHIATNDVWNEQDAWWRRVFLGKPAPVQEHPESILYAYLASPRDANPRWYAEGSAVFMETWMAGGLGRSQGAFDEMVFRAMVRDDAHFYSNLGLVSEGTKVDFLVGVNAYLYGTRFFGYMAYLYSPEKVIEWLSRNEDSERYYASQFRAVFGLSLEDAWDEWIEWEHQFQQANLEAVRAQPLTPARRLVDRGVGSASRSFIDPETKNLVGAFRYPGVVGHVGMMSLEDGSIDRLRDVKGPMLYRVTSTAFDPESRTLFYTEDNSDFRDVVAIDLETGKRRMLLKDARIGELVFDPSDRSLWGLRHLNGYVTLVNIPYPYEEWNQVFTWEYGQVLYEMDVSHDGKLISASMGEVTGNQYLRVFRAEDLRNQQAKPMAEFNVGAAVPEGFVFSQDDRYLYGSSYYTGVSNIFRYEIETGDLEAVSNAETGFFRPLPLDDGSLLVYDFTGEGFVPSIIDPVPLEDLSAITFLGSEIAKKHPIVRDWAVGSPMKVPLDDLVTNRGKYIPRKELKVSSGYPIIQGYRDTFALGYSLNIRDPVGLNSLTINASFSPDSSLDSSERLHADIEYKALNWRFRYWHNYADFYDLFGPTERARKGDAFIVGHTKSLIFDGPRNMSLDLDAAYYTGLDTLPNNQNVPTSFARLASARAKLNYSNKRVSLGAVDYEKGIGWDLVGYADYADSAFVPKIRAGFDFGFALPIKHSSIWFYNSAGLSGGDRDNSLANWYFGSFGNNYVDDGEVKRYRSFYSFPGFDIDSIDGQDFAKSVMEWNLPPLTFREVGTPSFYLTWVRAALFAGALVTDLGNSRYKETYYSVGAQADFHFTVVHRYPMRLSFGYAQGYIDGDKYDTEWMISLKIL